MLRGLIPPYLFMRDPDLPKPTNPNHPVLGPWDGGLTKREYFAAMAMQSLVNHFAQELWTTRDDYVICHSKDVLDYFPTEQDICEKALMLADALIDQLNEGGDNA